jgi:hypothetical protein
MVYQPVVRVAERVFARAERFGVTVNRTTRLADLSLLLQNFKVVTLIAHWRFMKMQPADILDLSGFLQAIRSPQTLVEQSLHRALKNLGPEMLDERFSCESSKVTKVRLIEVLNEVTGAAHRLYQRTDEADHLPIGYPRVVDLLSASPLERLTRAAIELAFPKHVTSGKAVQFADGMKTIPEVIESVPTTFTGLLDLTICNSVILGEAIKNYRSRCLVAVNRYPAELHVRLGIYGLAMSRLSRKPMSYMDALTRVAITEF